MKRIPLRNTRGPVAYALVDDEDYEGLSQYKWSLHWKGYAVRHASIDGHHTTLRMHRVVLGLKPGDQRQGDHINFDKLDNRRENLRIVTMAENLAHRRYVCVYWGKAHGKWCARVTLNGHRRHLGWFTSHDDALAAVAAARAEAVA